VNQGLPLAAILPEPRGVGGSSPILCSDGSLASLTPPNCPEEVAANK